MNFSGITWVKEPQPETASDTAEVARIVTDVLARVRVGGDAAVV